MLCCRSEIVRHDMAGCEAACTAVHLQRPLAVVDGDPPPASQPLHLLQSPARLAIRAVVHCATGKCRKSAQNLLWLDHLSIHRLEERPEVCSRLACQMHVRQLISEALARLQCA